MMNAKENRSGEAVKQQDFFHGSTWNLQGLVK